MCGCFSRIPHWGPGLQPRMCPDWESNQRPFGSQAGTQSTEPYQPGLKAFLPLGKISEELLVLGQAALVTFTPHPLPADCFLGSTQGYKILQLYPGRKSRTFPTSGAHGARSPLILPAANSSPILPSLFKRFPEQAAYRSMALDSLTTWAI